MRCQNRFSTPHALKYLGHSWDRFCGDAIKSGSECSRRFAGLALGSWNEFDPRFAPVRNQDRFPRVCQVGNGIETLTRFMLRNRLHRTQVCAALVRIARGTKLCRSAAQARGGNLAQFGFRVIVRSDKQDALRAMLQRKAACSCSRRMRRSRATNFARYNLYLEDDCVNKAASLRGKFDLAQRCTKHR
jgi:hypothetical protein